MGSLLDLMIRIGVSLAMPCPIREVLSVPEIHFLADMNISPLTVEQPRDHGWNILRVSEVMDITSKDSEILAYARRYNKVVISHGLDFSMLLAVGGYGRPSVINLRPENSRPDYVASRLIDVVATMERELAQGIVVSVDETSARYRSLPIGAE